MCVILVLRYLSVYCNKKDTSAECPAGKIAPRSFKEIPITFERKLVANLSSSPTVVTIRWVGDLLPAEDSVPTGSTASSPTQLVRSPVELKVKLFPVIP